MHLYIIFLEMVLCISSNHCSFVTVSVRGQYTLPLYWLCPVALVLNCPHFLQVIASTVFLYGLLGMVLGLADCASGCELTQLQAVLLAFPGQFALPGTLADPEMLLHTETSAHPGNLVLPV